MIYLKRVILLINILLFFILEISAQDEIIFNPAQLFPHEDGYYISGIYLDIDNNGENEFYNKCVDAYENPLSPQDNHHETGSQQNFSYSNCMIMPTCEHKGTAIEPPVPMGYIQMAPSLYMSTDSASLSAVYTPSLINMQSLTIETSSDVSINDTRKIPYNIDYSKDDGKTWESAYIQDYVAAQGGYRVTYTSESSLDFMEMAEASKKSPVILRISTNDISIERPNKGQYVKIHSIKIVADQASSVKKSDYDINSNLIVENNTIYSENFITVLNTLGQVVGSGKIVNVPVKGIYIVFFQNGFSQKIIINEK